MEQDNFIRALEELMEVPASTLSPITEIRSIEAWDSLKVVELVALLDSSYGIAVDYETLDQCRTVGDLIALKDRTVADPASPVPA